MHTFGLFKVGFSYPQPDVTKCIIQDMSGELLGLSEVKRYFKDTPNKVVARKRALSSAMFHAGLEKDDRDSIWKAYRSTGALVKPRK
jgi:hypothetical protein